MGAIRSYRELRVYQAALEAAMRIFELTRRFPAEEKFSMVDQMRRSSRSVCANIGEAWRKRRYEAAFIAKLNDSEAEAAETQVWIEFAVQGGYWTREDAAALYQTYHEVLGTLVGMINHAEKWVLPGPKADAGAEG